jgi:hypothetical protein
MEGTKPVNTPLASHLKLSKVQVTTTEEENNHMAGVSYAAVISSLMYAMICTRPNITYEQFRQ